MENDFSSGDTNISNLETKEVNGDFMYELRNATAETKTHYAIELYLI